MFKSIKFLFAIEKMEALKIPYTVGRKVITIKGNVYPLSTNNIFTCNIKGLSYTDLLALK